MQDHRDTLFFAESFYLCRTGHDDSFNQQWRVGDVESPAEHGSAAEISQQFVGAEPFCQSGRHQNTSYR